MLACREAGVRIPGRRVDHRRRQHRSRRHADAGAHEHPHADRRGRPRGRAAAARSPRRARRPSCSSCCRSSSSGAAARHHRPARRAASAGKLGPSSCMPVTRTEFAPRVSDPDFRRGPLMLPTLPIRASAYAVARSAWSAALALGAWRSCARGRAGVRDHGRRVLQRGARPLLHHAARTPRSTRSIPAHRRLGAHRPRVRRATQRRARRRARGEPGVPLLHSARPRRLALPVGLARRMRRGPREGADRSELQRLHRGNVGGVLHRAAGHRHRRRVPREPDPSTGCGTSAPTRIIATRPTPRRATR